MLSFDVMRGSNEKIFLKPIVDPHSKEDKKILDILLEKIMFRSEFKFYVDKKGKRCGSTITANYVFHGFIPLQFWRTIKERLEPVCGYEIVFNGIEDYFNYAIVPDFLNEMGYKFPSKINTDAEEYKYQQVAVYRAIYNRFASIEVGTSGGKTFITYLYCRWLFDNFLSKLDDNVEARKILIVVPTVTLVDQLINDFEEYDEFFERKLIVQGIYSDVKKRTQNYDIVCGTYQSLCKWEVKDMNQFRVFILDEAHRGKAFSISEEIFSKLLRLEYLFAMTGTFPRYDKLDYLTVCNMFGAPILTKKAVSLIEDGIATPIQIQQIKIIYPEYEQQYSAQLKEQGIFGSAKYHTEKRFFQNYTSRTNLIKRIMKQKIGTSMILINTVEYTKILFDYLSEKLPDWEFDIITGVTENRYDTIQKAKKSQGKYCIIATFQTMSTGISIPTMRYMYFVDGGKAENTIRQSIGRLMRLFNGKKLGEVFDFYDVLPGSSFSNHARERLKIYKEQQFPVKYVNYTLPEDIDYVRAPEVIDKTLPQDEI